MGGTIVPPSVCPISSALVSTRSLVNPITPASIYRTSYQAQPHIPVNISAGLPSQSVSGRVHAGITGAHIPRGHENAMDEDPTHGAQLYNYNQPNAMAPVVPMNSQPGLEITNWTNTCE